MSAANVEYRTVQALVQVRLAVSITFQKQVVNVADVVAMNPRKGTPESETLAIGIERDRSRQHYLLDKPLEVSTETDQSAGMAH